MRLYKIQTHVVIGVSRKGRRAEACKQLPTFLLDGDIQGITSSEHAVKIAMDLYLPFIKAGTVNIEKVSIFSQRIDDGDGYFKSFDRQQLADLLESF